MNTLPPHQNISLTAPARSDIPYVTAYAPRQHARVRIEGDAVLLELPPVGQAEWLRLTRDDAMGLGYLLSASAHALDALTGEA